MGAALSGPARFCGGQRVRLESGADVFDLLAERMNAFAGFVKDIPRALHQLAGDDPRILDHLVGRRLPIGKLLMTKKTYYEALDLPATSVGNDVASRHYAEGIEKEERLWGIPVVSTIKTDILTPQGGASHSFYVFAPENFFGNFFG